MSFWVSLLISFAFTVIGELLRPKPRLDSPKPTSLGDYRTPTADESRPIPVAYGTVRVTGPNAVWWGDFEARAIRKKVKTGLFSSQRITLGYQYWLGLQLALSWGTVDELISLEFDDKLVTLRNRVNTPDLVSFGMDEPTLFSSDEPRNGLFGPVKFYPGTFTQVQNPYLAAQFGEATIPAYRGIAYMVFEKCYLSNNDSLPAVAVTLRRTPNTLGLTGGRENINGDANPACMVYEIMTNTFWGSGIAQSTIDLPSFVAAANTLHAEGLGLSMLIDTSGSADEIIAEILRHVDGVVFIDPQTGRFTMRLARNDYVVASLPEVSPANVLADSFKYTRGSWDETKNTVKVKYIDRSQKYTERVVQHQNLANITARGGQVDADDYDYSGLSNATAANAVAARVLKTVSSPLSRVECEVNRTLFGLRPGSVFRLSWPQLGIAQIVYRITEIDYGTLDSGSMRIRAIEDVFSVAAVSFANPPTTGWTNPLDANLPLARQSAFEIPFGMIAPNASEYIAVTGSPASGPQRAYTIWEDPAGGTNFIERPDTQVFTPSATLAGALAANTAALITTGVVLNNPWGLDSVASVTQSEFDAGESLARIVSAAGEEIVAWRTITRNGDGTFTINEVMRGQYDTVPLAHPAGAVVWFISDGFGLVSDTPYTATVSSVALRATPFGVASKLPVASATTMTVTLTDRAGRPYPPGNLRFNGTYLPDTISGPLTVAWSPRNRLTQGRLPYSQTGADVTAEAGTTYTVRFFGETGTLLRTHSGLTALTQTWDTEDADSNLLTSLPPGSTGGGGSAGSVAALLHFDGADASTTFLDDTGKTWTRTGVAQIDTDQSRFGGSSLLLAPGDSIETSASNDFAFGTGDFTIEFFARRRVAGTVNYDWLTFGPNWDIYSAPDGSVLLWNGSGNILISSAGALGVGTWHHVAVTRTSGTVRMFVDGTQVGGSVTGNTTNFTNAQAVFVGYYPPNLRRLDGWVDELRIIRGESRYTTNFTPPSAPFSIPLAVSSLLHMDGTNGSTTFTDDTGKTWAASGNAQISTASSRFGTASALFDGTGDFISTAASTEFDLVSSGDFCVELWFNPTNQANGDGNSLICVGNAAGYWQLLARNNTIRLNARNATGGAFVDMIASQTLTNGQWAHIAWTRSGGTYRLFFNGVQLTPSTNTLPATFTTGDNACYIGANYNGGTSSTEGYVDEVRVTKGNAVYTANFTPPTTPFTASVGAVVDGSTPGLLSLTHFDGPNSGNSFGDDAPGGAWSVDAGTVVYTTAQARFGSASLAVPATTGARARRTFTAAQNIGTGDFTIELWMRVNALPASGPRGVFDTRSAGVASDATRPTIYLDSTTRTFRFFSGGLDRITSANNALLATTWQHIAVCRAAGTTRMFIDGVLVGSAVADTRSYSFSSFVVGNVSDVATVAGIDGQIDEVALWNTARYTANFTPPTAPFSPVTNVNATGVRDAMVHYYALDEAAGTTIRDVEPQAALGLTVFGSPSFSQPTIRSGGSRSIAFSGAARAESTVSPVEINTSGRHSGSFWVRLTSFSTTINTVYACNQVSSVEASNVQAYVAITTAGRLRYLHEYGAGVAEVVDATGMTPLVTNTNYHIVVTRDSVAAGGTNTVRFYVNGSLVDTRPYTNQRTGGTSAGIRFVLGGDVNGPVANSLNGRLQDLFITTDLLTDAEIAWLWNGGAGRNPADLLGSVRRLNNQVTVEVDAVRSGVVSRTPARWTVARPGGA